MVLFRVTLPFMKRRKKKPPNLLQLFETTCGWCGRAVPPGTPVYGGGIKARPGVDLSDKAGQVMPVRLIGAAKIVLLAVATPDSEARRDGYDFMCMTCSEACGAALRAAFQAEIDLGHRMGLA